jgi:hypothetical protein
MTGILGFLFLLLPVWGLTMGTPLKTPWIAGKSWHYG